MALWDESNIELSAKVCARYNVFGLLTASITMEVKNNYAHVLTQRTLNKFIEINFSVGCLALMLSISRLTISKNIDEIFLHVFLQ